MTTVLVAGASLAGLTAAETLRRNGYSDRIVVVDPSSELPHDRPPLSKQVLAGEWEPERAESTFVDRLPDLDLDLRLGTAATSFDARTRTTRLSDGTEIVADGVVIATGASPRWLPGPRPDGVYVLRTLEDCLALRDELDRSPQRVVVIGGGFIGSEVAATCRSRGLEVTLVEAAAAPLARVVPAAIGSFIIELHLDRGVDVRVGTGVAGFETGDDGRVRAVRLGDGTTIDADVVVVGIGVVPNTGWLEGSGLELLDGVRCDETCRAAVRVVAAGDVASWPNRRFGRVMRVEQWENAIEQGEHAARTLLAELDGSEPASPFEPIPWFWSDQYDRKIQMAGAPGPSDEVKIVEGSVAEQRFVALFRDHDRCTGVFGVSRPRHVMQARMKLADSLEWAGVEELFT